MSSAMDNGVCPRLPRNGLDNALFRLRTWPRSISTSWVYSVPSISTHPNPRRRAFIFRPPARRDHSTIRPSSTGGAVPRRRCKDLRDGRVRGRPVTRVGRASARATGPWVRPYRDQATRRTSCCRRVRGVVPVQWGALSNLLSVASWCGRPVGWAESTHVAKEGRMSVYRVTDLIGTSAESWEDAAAAALKVASGTLRDLRVAEVVAQDIHLDESGGLTYRTKIRVSFKYEQ